MLKMQCRLFLGYRVDIAYHAQKEFTPPFISNVKYLYEASKRTQRQDVIQKVIAEYPAAPAFFQLSIFILRTHLQYSTVPSLCTSGSKFAIYIFFLDVHCPQCHNNIKCLSLLSQSQLLPL